MSNKLASKIVKRDEAGMRNVPDRVIRSMSFVFLLICIFGTVGSINLIVYFFISKEPKELNLLIGIIDLVMMLIGVAYGVFTDYYYNWYFNCEYSFEKGKIIYSYQLSSSILGKTNCSVKIEICKLTFIKAKKNEVVLKGVIYETRPKRERRLVSGKISLRLDFKEREFILSELEKLK